MQVSDRPLAPSLLGVTVRRSLVLGRIFLIVGTGYCVAFAFILGFLGGTSFASDFPLVLPVFVVIGAMGGLMVFTNDRMKGVYEYLLAYGVPLRRLFGNVLLASFFLATIELAIAIGVGLAVHAATGNSISAVLAVSLGAYTVPMSYASVAFAAMVGMYWTSFSSPRSGMNSPVGLIPIIGIAPPGLTLVVAGVVGAAWGGEFAYVAVAGALVFLAATVAVLLGRVGRLLPPEHLLSPI